MVLSVADKINDLRKMLKLAFDIRSLSPLIYFEKEDRFVYNAEMMCTASEAVAQYMDDNFQQFLHNLRNGFVPEGSAVEAFAVSSGTQCSEHWGQKRGGIAIRCRLQGKVWRGSATFVAACV